MKRWRWMLLILMALGLGAGVVLWEWLRPLRPQEAIRRLERGAMSHEEAEAIIERLLESTIQPDGFHRWKMWGSFVVALQRAGSLDQDKAAEWVKHSTVTLLIVAPGFVSLEVAREDGGLAGLVVSIDLQSVTVDGEQVMIFEGDRAAQSDLRVDLSPEKPHRSIQCMLPQGADAVTVHWRWEIHQGDTSATVAMWDAETQIPVQEGYSEWINPPWQ